MARRRSQTAPTNTTDDNNVVANETRKVAKNMAQETLTMDQIAELMSKARTKGAGELVLQNFLDSGEQGIVVDLSSGPLAGKNANQASATLTNAKKRTRTTGDKVEVVNPQFANILVKKAGKGDDAQVALINTELVDLGSA
jgi:preprotein translocase subunit SecF